MKNLIFLLLMAACAGLAQQKPFVAYYDEQFRFDFGPKTQAVVYFTGKQSKEVQLTLTYDNQLAISAPVHIDTLLSYSLVAAILDIKSDGKSSIGKSKYGVSDKITGDKLTNFAELLVKAPKIDSFVSQLRIFYQFYSALNATTVAGTLMFYDKTVIREFLDDKNRSQIIGPKPADASKSADTPHFTVERVKIEFNSGYIENFEVVVRLKGNFFCSADNSESNIKNEKFISFRNNYPFGYSRKSDLYRLMFSRLYPVLNKYDPDYDCLYKHAFIYVSDVLDKAYLEYMVDRRDFSPGDTVVSINPALEPMVTLMKPSFNQLIEAKLYTDFLGIDDDKPNGLIQTEIDKTFSLQTFRTKLGPRGRFFNFGYLEEITPSVTWSKIEQNNRTLFVNSLERTVNNSTTVENYASTLDIRRFEWFSAGMDLNIITLDMPCFKSTFRINGGFRNGLTNSAVNKVSVSETGGISFVRDSVNIFTVPSWRVYPQLQLDIRPDERFGLRFQVEPTYFTSNTNRYKQVASNEEYQYYLFSEATRLYWAFEMMGYLHLAPNASNRTGKFYGRFRINHQHKQMNTNFYQLQVGYAVYLFSKRD